MVDDQSQRLVLLLPYVSFAQHVLDADVVLYAFLTGVLPMHEAACISREEAFPEDVIGDMSQSFDLAARIRGIRQVDALNSGMRIWTLEEDITNPQHRWTVRCMRNQKSIASADIDWETMGMGPLRQRWPTNDKPQLSAVMLLPP